VAAVRIEVMKWAGRVFIRRLTRCFAAGDAVAGCLLMGQSMVFDNKV
jgi:hypothetical protein